MQNKTILKVKIKYLEQKRMSSYGKEDQVEKVIKIIACTY